MRRRTFITLIGGAAAAWPLAARAQQGERVRRIGVLMNSTADDAVSQDRLTALVQGLQELGWTVGRNLQIDYRWGAGNVERYRTFAAELVALTPDILMTVGARLLRLCNARPALCRSCSLLSRTRSGAAWSRAWRGQAVIPPVLRYPNMASAGNG